LDKTTRENNFLVADSSFFVCFLDDIKKPENLKKILDTLKFYLPSCILKEIARSDNFKEIEKCSELRRIESEYPLADILRPFVSDEQYEKGESEAIALAFILFRLRKLNRLILDDGEARDFVKYHVNFLFSLMTGTVGFIGDCCCKYNLFTKSETLTILECIKSSKFHISDNVINTVKQRIGVC